MRRVIIVQARMTSTRLPGKVLLDLAGRPMLDQQLRRLELCRSADEIVLATTTNPDDDVLAAAAAHHGIRCYRGGEHDVLARYAGAAREAQADVVVRVTSDCPLIDAACVDEVIDALTSGADVYDYASNRLVHRYPRGLDTEALFADVLVRMERIATSARSREHVTWHCWRERPDLYVLRSVFAPSDDSDLRWTVDTADDLALVRRLYADLALADRPELRYTDIVAHVRANPALMAINAHVEQRDAA
jgi:spore coat polysaccharide biosynthesis protein SpsF